MRSNLIALTAVVITAWASLATSQSETSIDSGTLHVVSDCVTPTFEQDVHAVAGLLTNGLDYTQIGFPQSQVHLGRDNYGPLNNGTAMVNRACIETYGADHPADGNKFIYSCLDNGAYTCSIVISTP